MTRDRPDSRSAMAAPAAPSASRARGQALSRRHRFGFAIGLALLALGAQAWSHPMTGPVDPPIAGPQAGAGTQTSGPPPLTRQDLDSWLDGFLPYALARADIAGAVVVVVRDGAVLTEKGYGYADVDAGRRVDPRTTLFRPGSISKLFTWTAVMQLVESGKLDLDADINRYLDFTIPPRDGRPLTLRDLMTHTSGFEDRLKFLFVDDPDRRLSLGDYLKRNLPQRIYPPGEIPAYSNYGAALGGYLVERVSGEPFEAYMERHILRPLGMAHSTFREPLPEALAAGLSRSYERASLPAKAFEIVGPAPAGALSATGDDLARFMIAHLQGGRIGDARILNEATVRLMHAQQREVIPHLKNWTLGFLPDDRNGHAIIGHDGDTVWFHSRLALLPDDNVGILVSLNSRQNDADTISIRHQLVRGFVDRYFPDARTPVATPSTAHRHAAEMAGYYRSAQRAETSFLALAGLLMAVELTAVPDGTLRAGNVTGPAGEPVELREVGSYLWQSAAGDRLAAILRNGRVIGFGIDGDLYAAYERMPNSSSPVWNWPLALASLTLLAVTVVSWPIRSLVQRRRGPRSASTGHRELLQLLVRLTALIDLLAVAVYVEILRKVMGITLLDDRMNIWLRAGQCLSLLGMVGACLSVWNLMTVWRDRYSTRTARVASTLEAFACVAFVWFAISQRLISAGTQF